MQLCKWQELVLFIVFISLSFFRTTPSILLIVQSDGVTNAIRQIQEKSKTVVCVNNVNFGPKMLKPICLEQAVQPFGPLSIQKVNKRNHSTYYLKKKKTLVVDCQTIFAQFLSKTQNFPNGRHFLITRIPGQLKISKPCMITRNGISPT